MLPYYAAPVSDSLNVETAVMAENATTDSLKAENERLREASAPLVKFCEWYDVVDEIGAFPDIQDVLVPLGQLRALRAALNVEDSN